MQKNNFEEEGSCTDWEGTKKHHRKQKKDEREIENTPKEDMFGKGIKSYNREGWTPYKGLSYDISNSTVVLFK